MYLSTTIVTSSSIVHGHGLAQSFFKKEKNRTYKERESERKKKKQRVSTDLVFIYYWCIGSGDGDGPTAFASGVVGTVPACPSVEFTAFKPSPGGS